MITRLYQAGVNVVTAVAVGVAARLVLVRTAGSG